MKKRKTQTAKTTVESKEQEYQQKYQDYSKALLTSYRYCNDQQKRVQTLQQIFHEKIDSLREIFSFERFRNNQAQQNYDLCLYKFFLEFASFQGKLREEDCWAVLDWLRDSGLERILSQQQAESAVVILITEENQQGVKWALEQYHNRDQELLQTLADQRLVRDIQKTSNIEMVEIIHAKVKEIIADIETKRKKIQAEWEKLVTKESLAESLDHTIGLLSS